MSDGALKQRDRKMTFCKCQLFSEKKKSDFEWWEMEQTVAVQNFVCKLILWSILVGRLWRHWYCYHFSLLLWLSHDPLQYFSTEGPSKPVSLLSNTIVLCWSLNSDLFCSVDRQIKKCRELHITATLEHDTIELNIWMIRKCNYNSFALSVAMHIKFFFSL